MSKVCASRAGRAASVGAEPGDPTLSRRRMLVGLVVAVPTLAGCGLLGGADEPPDPLRVLLAAARADAALAAAAVAADPALAERVQPFVDARTAHADALAVEITRVDPDAAVEPGAAAAEPEGGTAAPQPPAEPGLADVQEAALLAARDAGEVALGLPADRVGLVAAVAACCGAYAAVLV